MRAAVAVLVLLLVGLLSMTTYAVAVNVATVAQLGAGQTEVLKYDFVVRSVSVHSSTISTVFALVQVNVAGTYRLDAAVRVGPCQASGAVTRTLSTVPVPVTIALNAACTFTTNVEVRVTASRLP
ncbi:MAG: hypothetical protein RMJ30_04395 [Nitrososphaerota archaeon]|nr:hypothetical protein [Nitrososphaerota archaeon]